MAGNKKKKPEGDGMTYFSYIVIDITVNMVLSGAREIKSSTREYRIYLLLDK